MTPKARRSVSQRLLPLALTTILFLSACLQQPQEIPANPEPIQVQYPTATLAPTSTQYPTFTPRPGEKARNPTGLDQSPRKTKAPREQGPELNLTHRVELKPTEEPQGNSGESDSNGIPAEGDCLLKIEGEARAKQLNELLAYTEGILTEKEEQEIADLIGATVKGHLPDGPAIHLRFPCPVEHTRTQQRILESRRESVQSDPRVTHTEEITRNLEDEEPEQS